MRNPLPERLKAQVKRFIGKFGNIHKRGDKDDIVIVTTRRSGSTWLMNIIYSNNEIKYAAAPPDWHSKDPRLSDLDVNKYNLVCPSKNDRLKLESYFSDLLQDNIQASPPWNILDSNYSFITSRYLLKTTNLHSLIRWLDNCFEIRIVYLFRHPFAVVNSIISRNWGHTLDAFLDNKRFTEKWLEDIEYARNIEEEGDYFQKLVLEWVLQNLVPLRMIQKGRSENWLVLSYEELALIPGRVIEYLSEELNLEQINRMKAEIQVPSKTTKGSSKRKIKKRSRQVLVTKWENEVSKDQKMAGHEILEKLNLQVYTPDSYLPKKELLNFSEILKSTHENLF